MNYTHSNIIEFDAKIFLDYNMYFKDISLR